MDAQALSRIRIATAVALASAGAAAALIASSPAAAGPETLTPDLVTLGIHDEELTIAPDGKRTLLAFSNEIGNRADGPLEVFPSVESTGCDADADPANDRDAWQRVYTDSDGSGAYERGVDEAASERRFGCMRYHPAHDHWHVLDIARYELRRESNGRLVESSRKVGFCLTDTRPAFAGPSTPAEPVYPLGTARPNGCDAGSTQGISPGWVDLYSLAVPGQQLDVGGLRRGRYCLISRADPRGLITELDETNNVRRVRLALRPGKLVVRRLGARCRL